MSRIHLAESDSQHFSWGSRGVQREGLRLRLLLSYWYYKDVDLDSLFSKYFTPPYPDVFADSGGFSANSQGATINVYDYAAWVKRWKHLFTSYANLDVIGNPKATAHNQSELENMGLTPLPVFHTGSPWSELERLIAQYPYVALGGMVPYMRYPKKIMPWLVQCFRMAKDRTVFHGFGAASWTVVTGLPWYSVDSSSWGTGFRYGQVPVFDWERGRFIEVHLGSANDAHRYAKQIRALGFDPGDFADRTRNDRAKICAISALSYMMAEKWLRKRWGEIHIPGRQEAPAGLRTHLVTAADGETERGGNMSVRALSEARDQNGPCLHLSDTSSGVNFGDAATVLNARMNPSDDWVDSEVGRKFYLADSSRVDMQHAEKGLSGYRLDAYHDS